MQYELQAFCGSGSHHPDQSRDVAQFGSVLWHMRMTRDEQVAFPGSISALCRVSDR